MRSVQGRGVSTLTETLCRTPSEAPRKGGMAATEA